MVLALGGAQAQLAHMYDGGAAGGTVVVCDRGDGCGFNYIRSPGSASCGLPPLPWQPRPMEVVAWLGWCSSGGGGAS